ncbi:MAG TPA: LacI family DNA-binding transcriptional regulator [Streptosporangiales bacterium]
MARTGGPHVTLEQVAIQAGVSLATASRVLNGGGTRRVREELRERVLSSAQALHYVANAHAQTLARATSNTVGLVTHDVSDPYFAQIASGAMRVATEQGLLVLLASTFRDPERELAYASALRAQRARAILLLGSGFDDRAYTNAMRAELTPYRDAGGRVAAVSHHDFAVDAVLPDNRGGAADLARALLELGHRRFAVISGPPRLTTVQHRVQGFRDALAEAGVELAADAVVESEFSQTGGYDGTLELLRRRVRCTALFCVTDVMAIGALEALRENAVRVPDDLSVAGFDDIPIVRHLNPPLSTMHLPLEEIGERVMSLVLAEPRKRRHVETVRPEVTLRESTARVRRGGRRPR